MMRSGILTYLIPGILFLAQAFFGNNQVFAQTHYIEGNISDRTTNEPIPFVNVFFNNTTKGTTTDVNGDYILGNLDSGLYTLVISIVGYEVINREIRLKDGKHLKLDYKLKESVTNLSEVLLVGKEDKKWTKDFRRFKREFLGANSGSMKYEFINPYVLEFYKDKKNKVFKATANAPLEIINYDLGYKVHFFLRDFEQMSGSLRFYGQTRFEELTPTDSKSKLTWAENRASTYEGSLHHFFHALIENSIEEEGFMVYKVSGIHPYQRTNTFYDKIGVEYQELKPEDLVFDSDYQNEKIIKFQGELIIVYKLKDWINSPFPDLPYEATWIRLNVNGLRVHQSGYVYNPIGYEIYGYRSGDRVLQMLPFGYHPEYESRTSTETLNSIQAQNTLADYKKSQQEKLQNLKHEKLLIHTDKSLYTNGDRVNISVYSVNQRNAELSIAPGIVYMDLIDEDNNIISTNRMPSHDGLASGILFLPDNIFNGCYRLRAYTDWIRDYDPESISFKNIYISSPFQNYTTQNVKNSILDSIYINISAEGGNLVKNLKNKIVIKANDIYGNGISLNGKIIDQNEQVIEQFRTNKFGLSTLEMVPQAKANYHLLIDFGSRSIKYEFPDIKNSGITLQVDHSNEHNFNIHINTTQDLLNNQYILICQSRGKVFYDRIFIFNQLITRLTIPKANLPDGITEILILNDRGGLMANRYVYRDNEAEPVVIEAFSDKDSIGDSLIRLMIRDINDVPLQGEFSISILSDTLFISDQIMPSQFNYSNFYFKEQFRDYSAIPDKKINDDLMRNKSIRDHLLISLRDYKFSIDKNYREDKYEMKGESSLHISGMLLADKKPCDGCLIQAFPFYAIDQAQTTYSDSTGWFDISGFYFYDSTDIVFSILDRKGKPVNAEIDLTQPKLMPPPVKYSQCFMPGTITLEKYESILDSLSALEKEGKFILLEEVTVEDKSLFEEVDDGVYRPYGIPDAIIEIDDRDKNAINVLQYLQGKIPGVFVNQYTDPTTGIEKYNVQIRGIRSVNLEKSPLILIDGIPFEGDVSLINPRDVKSIEILKDPTNLGMYGIRGANGIIAINTDKNPGIVLKEKDENLIILKVPGYLKESSIFGYAPGSAVGKGLIYWNANLQTNEEGDVKLFLPGIKLPEEYYVFIEGITRSGIPFNQKIKVFN